MPQTLALFLFTLGAPIGVSNLLIGLAGLGPLAFLGGIAQVGLSIGLSLLSQFIFRPSANAPKPEDVQQSYKQPAQPRYKHYGRVKISGPWVFGESKTGDFYKVLALGQGPFDAIEEFWIDNNEVELDGSDIVTTEPYSNVVNPPKIEYRLGASTETAYSELISEFTEYTSAHRGDGVASLYAKMPAVAQSNYYELYPNGIQTSFRVIARCAKVKNPVSGTTAWSDNAASIIRDYIISNDGMRFPESILQTTLAQDGWETAYARADEDVDLDAGGSEKRYRLWGSYRFDERPADVLSRMLRSCDGQLKITADGGLTLDIGDWYEPTVTIDNTMITAFSDVGKGNNILTTANTIRATFTSPDLDYQTTDADPWVDDTDVSERGEIAIDNSFIMTPSHTQCRRLMKLESYRANPEWIGTFTCNLKALKAFGERFVRIDYPALGIDGVFEQLDFKFNIGQDNILRSVTLQVRSLPEEAYNWDETTEEGTAPVSDTTVVDNSIPVPTGLTLNYNTTTLGLEIDIDDPGTEALYVQYRIKATSESDWTIVTPPDGETFYIVYGLQDGVEYEVQARFVSIGGRQGDWTSSATITITQDVTPPSDITLNSATGGSGQVTINWTTPNSANFNRTVIKRNTVDNEAGATAITNSPFYGVANATYEIVDSGLAADDYYYWLYAQNGSGIDDGSGVASGAITVT